MSLISFSSLTKSFGARDVLTGLTGGVPHHSRIGLVGPNGVGKTTLLSIFAGLEEASAGEVHRARGLRVGYLPQEASGAWTSGNTLWGEMLTAFGDLLGREAELRQLETAMAAPAQFQAASEKYGVLQEQFERDGGYLYETRIRQALQGLGFSTEDYEKPLSQLSGGQKTRALLARLLLESPDLLILDEPTNHLDIAAVEWLEKFLGEWKGSALIVSHDRYFLDEVVNKVWEMSTHGVEEYSGNYSAYLVQRAERRARQALEFEAQQAFIDKEEAYIRRNIAGQNTAQAKGRRRRLARLKATEGGIVERPRELQTLKLSLDTNLRSGDRVLETHNLTVGYADDGKPLFAAPDLLLWRGEVAALIGPNGAGKTTFLRTLLSTLPPLGGRVKLGSSLKIGYFAQAHEGLNPERTVIEEIQAVREMPAGAARDYLAKFLFTGDDPFKKIMVLSGGERGRVALAKLALEGANFLLLDEPTNHLDIPSQEILEAVLSEFDGTILLVSHDRYLIDALATQIWSLEQGRLTMFKGNYREFAEWRQARDGEGALPATPKSPKSAGQTAVEAKAKVDGRRRAQRLSELEQMIASLEKRLGEIAAELEQAGANVDQVRALGEEYAQVEGDLVAHITEWEQILQE